MHGIEKYDNLKAVIPKLQAVLVEAIQSEFLEIKQINKECSRFIRSCHTFPNLVKAHYVIFSQHIKKNEHKHEIFVFIDEEGTIIQHVTGKEMELHGLLTSCTNLHISDEFLEENEGCSLDDWRH
jgi:hypothetical protein